MPFTYDIASTLPFDSTTPDTGTYSAQLEGLTNANTNANPYSKISLLSPDTAPDGQPNSVTVDTSPKNTPKDTTYDIASTFSSNSVPQRIDLGSTFNNPNSPSELPSTIPSSPDESDASRSPSSETPNTGMLLSKASPDSGQDLHLPRDFQFRVQEIHDHKARYAIFELTESKKGLVYQPNIGNGNEFLTWGDFVDRFFQSKPGFALYRQDDTTVLSLMNLFRPCGVIFDPQAKKDCPDERILKPFESAWVKSVQVLFKHVLSFDSIRDLDTLEGICEGNLKGRTPVLKYSGFGECVD